MLHGATKYDEDNKTSVCITLHSAITQRLHLGCTMLELLHHIKCTLQWQLSRGSFISCDLRPPNLIAFTSALLNKAKGIAGMSEDMAALTIDNVEMLEDGKGPVAENGKGPVAENGKVAEEDLATLTELAESFPCENGPLVWTLIDYGFCLDEGGCTTIPEGAAWDLIKLFVDGLPGKRVGLTMDPRVWLVMLSSAVCQLQAHLNGI
jgi:hypothetical protein